MVVAIHFNLELFFKKAIKVIFVYPQLIRLYLFLYPCLFPQIMVGNRVTEIEQLRQQEENNMVQWNQLLGEKDSQILELQDKLDSLLQPRMNSARSREELEAIADSEGGLVAVTKQLKNISALLMVS